MVGMARVVIFRPEAEPMHIDFNNDLGHALGLFLVGLFYESREA